MFYVYDLPRQQTDQAIKIDDNAIVASSFGNEFADENAPESNDIDFVDDTLLNTAPHNKIEQQLLRGDVVGLALMSGAIIWSAMGAFG